MPKIGRFQKDQFVDGSPRGYASQSIRENFSSIWKRSLVRKFTQILIRSNQHEDILLLDDFVGLRHADHFSSFFEFTSCRGWD